MLSELGVVVQFKQIKINYLNLEKHGLAKFGCIFLFNELVNLNKSCIIQYWSGWISYFCIYMFSNSVFIVDRSLYFVPLACDRLAFEQKHSLNY